MRGAPGPRRAGRHRQERGHRPDAAAGSPNEKCAGVLAAGALVFPALDGDYLTLTSLISNCTATFGGNGVRGSAP